MPGSNDYTTRNLLGYSYHQTHYKFIGIDLSRQTNTTIPQKNNFTGKLEEDSGTMFFIAEKQNYSKLSFRLINSNRIMETKEHQKVLNLLNILIDSRFETRIWNIVNDQ